MHGDAWRFACTLAHKVAQRLSRSGPGHGYVHEW
jgi:hypothetical protein